MSGRWVPKVVNDRAASAPILLAASASQKSDGGSGPSPHAEFKNIREPTSEESERSYHVSITVIGNLHASLFYR